MSQRQLSSFIDGFLEYTKDVEAPEKFLRWSAISCIAGALERKTWIRYGKYYVHPNEFILLIGAPGMAKKSSSSGLAFSLLREVEQLKFMSAHVTPASLIKQLKDAGAEKSVKIDGENFVNSSLFLYSSEATVTLGNRIAGSIIELLTDFWDCGNNPGWSNTKSWSKETLTGGRTDIYNPCLNILACSTPAWLVKAIGPEEIAGGFASRIIFVVQTEKPERTVGWPDEDDNKPMRQKLVNDLRLIAKLSGQFRIHLEAKTLANQYKAEIDQHIETHQSDIFNGYYTRKLWHILKLAQVLAADQSSDLEILPEHMARAYSLLQAIEGPMRFAFGVIGDNKKAAVLNQLWESIRHKKSTSKREILHLNWKNADKQTMDEHLKTLLEMRKLHARIVGADIFFDVIENSPLF